MQVATKLDRMLIYIQQLLTKKLLDPLVPWSSKITWQTKTIISPVLQCLWPRNLAGWRLTLRGFYHIVT